MRFLTFFRRAKKGAAAQSLHDRDRLQRELRRNPNYDDRAIRAENRGGRFDVGAGGGG